MINTNTRIYVANLGKYNEGELVGKWIDLPATDEELEQLYIDIKVAHRDEKGEFVSWYEEDGIIYEEVAIHDYETDLNELHIGEWDNIQELSNLVEECEDLDEWDYGKLLAIVESCGGGLDNLETALEKIDCYTLYEGVDTNEELGYYYYEAGCLEIPDHLVNYFDFEAYGRDCAWDGEFTSYGFLIRC